MEKELEKKYKQVLLEMLVYFDKICKDNHLVYLLCGGSALGAVRHGGFIPWDDDIDVCMPINDYKRLIEIWDTANQDEHYFLDTVYNDIYLPDHFSRMKKRNTASVDLLNPSLKIKYEIPIDIFPIFNLPEGKLWKKITRKIAIKLHYSSYYFYKNPDASEKVTEKMNKKTRIYLFLLEKISNISSSSMHGYSMTQIRKNKLFTMSDLFPPKDISFENIIFFGPNNPDGYLKDEYGDYMQLPPEKDRVGHEIKTLDLEYDYPTLLKMKKRISENE